MDSIPRLYAIVDRATLDARGVRVKPFAQELAAGGVRLVQYRDKVNGPQEVLRACEEIAEAFAGVEATLILNDRADLAALAGWGVHVGQWDLTVADALRVIGCHTSRFPAGMEGRKAKTTATAGFDRGVRCEVRGASGVVGVSTHTEEQVRVAEVSDADYVAVGPVFGTATKLDAEPVVGLEGVRRARALTHKPLVAIGGISLENAASVMEAGADCVAVIGALIAQGGMSTRERAEALLRVVNA